VSVPAILAPVLVQVLLTFALLVWMGFSRVSAVNAGEVKVSDIALGQRAWPTRAQLVANSYHSQLELPLLFYVLVALALPTRKADLLFVAMSWLFVAVRIAHAVVHTTSNDVLLRFRIFVAGAVILMAMWAIFALRILVGAVPS
jgi:hypothetical protein